MNEWEHVVCVCTCICECVQKKNVNKHHVSCLVEGKMMMGERKYSASNQHEFDKKKKKDSNSCFHIYMGLSNKKFPTK